MSKPPKRSEGSDRRPVSRFPRWFRAEAISLAELGVQTFAVVLGILLALAINSWNESRHQQQRARLAMQSILDETAVNMKMLQQRADFLDHMAAAMEKSPANRAATTKKPCYTWHRWNGLRYPLVITAAYQTAISTQAMAHMPYKRVEEMEKVYSLLDLTEKIYDTDGAQILLGNEPQSLGFCVAIVREIANWNVNTIEGMERFMREYDRTVPASEPAAPPGH